MEKIDLMISRIKFQLILDIAIGATILFDLLKPRMQAEVVVQPQ